MTRRHTLVDELAVTADLRERIRELLHLGFPDAGFTRTRTYLKQLPRKRLLAWAGEALAGHLGIEHRVIRTPDGPAPILGVIDVCVRPEVRGRGVATAMLGEVEQLARSHEVPFLVLFATDDRLYRRRGFRRASNRLTWTKIDEHETLGIAREPLRELMVKEVGDRRWREGEVDLLGYQF